MCFDDFLRCGVGRGPNENWSDVGGNVDYVWDLDDPDDHSPGPAIVCTWVLVGFLISRWQPIADATAVCCCQWCRPVTLPSARDGLQLATSKKTTPKIWYAFKINRLLSYLKGRKVKVCIALYGNPSQNCGLERQLPYGITVVLPATRHRWAPPPHFNPSHAGRYSIYLPRRDGRLSWPWWLVIFWDALPVCRQKLVTTWPGVKLTTS